MGKEQVIAKRGVGNGIITPHEGRGKYSRGVKRFMLNGEVIQR